MPFAHCIPTLVRRCVARKVEGARFRLSVTPRFRARLKIVSGAFSTRGLLTVTYNQVEKVQ